MKIDYSEHYDKNYWTLNKTYRGTDGQHYRYMGPSLSWEGFNLVAEALSRVWKPGTLLDVGCGAGDLSGRLMAKGFDCWGVDISRHAVEHCHPAMDGRLSLVDITKDPLGTRSYDYLMATDLLEHIYTEDLDHTFQALLRRANRFFFLVAVTDGEEFVLRKGQEVPLEWEATAVAGHVNVRKPSYWIKYFEHAGLEIDWERMYLFQAIREKDKAWKDTPGWNMYSTYFLQRRIR